MVGSGDSWELLSFGDGVEPDPADKNASGIELRGAKKLIELLVFESAIVSTVVDEVGSLVNI